MMDLRPVPPQPEKKPHRLEMHGDVRIDPYYYFRERSNPEVLAHLRAENAYYEKVTAPLRAFEKKLFDELKSRIKREDESVPYRYRGHYYQVRYPRDAEYPVYLRWPDGRNDARQILLDANRRAGDSSYYQVTGVRVSPANDLLAFGEDFTGRRLYQIRFKELATGRIREDEFLENTTGSGTFSGCGKYFFYVVKHPETLRAYRLYRHRLGTSPADDVLIYEETDPEYDIAVTRSKTDAFIWLVIAANTTTEYRYISARRPLDDFAVFQPREKGVEYYPYHIADETFLVVTNAGGAENFKIMRQWGLQNPKTELWLAHRPDVLIEELEEFDTWTAIVERSQGLTRIRILDYEKKRDDYIEFPEETYTAYLGINAEMQSRRLRYVYNSFTVPASVMEYDIDTGKSKVLKEEEIPGGYDKSAYRSRRIWAPARDGRRIPVSLVWHRDTPLDGTAPLLLYGYGAYGITVDDHFSRNRLSLLDRGFVFATAHVRGGEYLGRRWYEEGKLLRKKNTFFDFIDAARYLIDRRYTSPGRMFAMGGSAGGLLVGAVANMAPDLFRGMVAQVPFVDVLTTMLDESIPLTTGEYDEWGDPHQKNYYDYIKSYSPYDNVRAQTYPAMLITAGLHDSQVQYWEPAKWAAKLRDHHTGTAPILLHTDMEAGHGGKSGRFKSLEDTAREFAFLLDLAGKTDAQ